ncbi:MAG: hypothetical protein IJ247_01490 [Bacilli bacterium]|nr:hypothetical protein [Bacilli bacterium]
MISSVYLSGTLGERVDDQYRYVEIKRCVPGPTGKFETDRFLVKSMLSPKGPFMSEPKGVHICLKGRIEMDKRYGLVIVDEIDEISHITMY